MPGERIERAVTSEAARAEPTTGVADVQSGEGDPVARVISAGLDPFDETRTAEQTIGFRKEGARIIIEIGRRLVQAREFYRSSGGRGHDGEGFRSFCDRCGIGHSTAYNYIRVVERLAETGLLDSSPLLDTSAGVSKLLAITELDPEDIRQLDEGGAVEGIGDLDEIERMRVGELRHAIGERRDSQRRAVLRVKELEERLGDACARRGAAGQAGRRDTCTIGSRSRVRAPDGATGALGAGGLSPSERRPP